MKLEDRRFYIQSKAQIKVLGFESMWLIWESKWYLKSIEVGEGYREMNLKRWDRSMVPIQAIKATVNFSPLHRNKIV